MIVAGTTQHSRQLIYGHLSEGRGLRIWRKWTNKAGETTHPKACGSRFLWVTFLPMYICSPQNSHGNIVFGCLWTSKPQCLWGFIFVVRIANEDHVIMVGDISWSLWGCNSSCWEFTSSSDDAWNPAVNSWYISLFFALLTRFMHCRWCWWPDFSHQYRRTILEHHPFLSCTIRKIRRWTGPGRSSRFVSGLLYEIGEASWLSLVGFYFGWRIFIIFLRSFK